MSKEFILYIDSHALQFISNQTKLNQRLVKWEIFLQNITFVIKHTSGQSNKFANVLSKRILIMEEFKVAILGFDVLKDMYKEDLDFGEAYAACEDHISKGRSPWIDYMIQEWVLLKGSNLYIPKCSKREKLIKEKHCGSLVGHFGQNKHLIS